MPLRLEQTERLLGEVLQDEALRDYLLPEEEGLQERAKVLREAIRRSAQEQKELEKQKVRESILSQEKLEGFRSSLLEGWLENRLVAPLFQLVGSYEEIPEASASSEGRFGIDEWLPKDMFVPEPQIFGAESIAHQFGFSLTEGEVSGLLAKLSDSPGEGEDRRPFPEKVQATLRKMADEGYSPSVILTPLSWRLVRDVGIEGRPRSRTNSAPRKAYLRRQLATISVDGSMGFRSSSCCAPPQTASGSSTSPHSPPGASGSSTKKVDSSGSSSRILMKSRH
jgi:hypothetical protein